MHTLHLLWPTRENSLLLFHSRDGFKDIDDVPIRNSTYLGISGTWKISFRTPSREKGVSSWGHWEWASHKPVMGFPWACEHTPGFLFQPLNYELTHGKFHSFSVLQVALVLIWESNNCSCLKSCCKIRCKFKCNKMWSLNLAWNLVCLTRVRKYRT